MTDRVKGRRMNKQRQKAQIKERKQKRRNKTEKRKDWLFYL
jgi:hypothetical protein